jgi:hypothetical protein
VAEWAREVERLQEELEAAQGHLTKSAARVTEATEKVTRQAEEVERLRAAEHNVDAIRAKMTEVESINAKVRANAEKAKVMAALNEAGVKAKQHDTTVNDLAAAKKLMLERVEYPVPGLGINDSGVTFNDLPLEQASTAEQLRVSVAIGLALNPKLKVLLVRNGNALDSKSLALVSEMAEKAGAQIWMERVAESAEGVTVMIEDGHLA